LLNDPDSYVVTDSTFANADNLPDSFLEDLRNKYEGTRLGRQELNAEMLEDIPGALWQREWIDSTRITNSTPDEVAKRCVRIVVSIDPAITSGEDSDLTGIIAGGIDEVGHGYVLADETCRETPNVWAARAIALLKRFRGDLIVGETNNGGDMIESTLRNVDENVPYRKITASRGKYVRAEPIAAIYEQHRIHHVGTFDDLEDECCMFTVDNVAQNSPNRVDATVWCMSELFDSPMTFGALSVLSAEVNKSPEQRRAEELDMRKVRTSSLQKPVTGKETLSCPECNSKSTHTAGSMKHCSVCGLSWVGEPLMGLGGSKPRYDLLMKGR
jgi:phage terminase large subunit-like protein